jgi:hypothetical protein
VCFHVPGSEMVSQHSLSTVVFLSEKEKYDIIRKNGWKCVMRMVPGGRPSPPEKSNWTVSFSV